MSDASRDGAAPRRARPGRGGLPRNAEHARVIATGWLDSVGPPPHDPAIAAARIAELAPHARSYPPGSGAYRAVRRLLSTKQVPTPEAVAGEVAAGERRVRERAERAAAQQADAMAELLARPDLGAHASGWVADFWRAHGQGPLWREVGAAVGVTRAVRTPLIEHLAAAGWLRTGSAARTLRPGPRYTGPGPTPWDPLEHPTASSNSPGDVTTGSASPSAHSIG